MKLPSNDTLDQIHADMDALFEEEALLEEIIPMEEIVQQQVEEEVKQNTASSLTSDTLSVVGEATSDPFFIHSILEGTGDFVGGVGEAIGEIVGSILD